jgi:hypothetical protein
MMRKKAKVKKAQGGAIARKMIKALTKTKKVVKKVPIKKSTINDFLKEPPKKKKPKATYGKTMKARTGLKTPTNNGMRALPKAVRNKIGFAKKGKTVKKAGYGTKAKKAKMGCSTKRKKK